ncbi:MAG: teichoic acid D-Ala incorporation-associated protein DltX [Lactobacillales bacterium]|nr:teichoic acid D-Ala incorporation-associated protein DltX [Lactobacillales bacterium]
MNKTKEIWIFIAKTLFYTAIILALLYFFHYKNFSKGGFVYNEF